MRRLFTVLVLVAGASAVLIVPACSSKPAASGEGDAGDAAGVPQPVGGPCDPTLAEPCAQVPCFSVACAAGAGGLGTCVETPLGGACAVEDAGDVLFFEGGARDSGVLLSAGCLTDNDCPRVDGAALYACGYSAFDGCTTTGVCVVREAPHTSDGAVETACGCNLQPVDYVTDQMTAAPVESPSPCAPHLALDSGTDATADAGTDADSGADAGAGTDADAGTDVDAASDADAEPDAPADAPADG